jgi:hypothetical protein
MVASRWPYRLALAASVRRSTSASVRYSLVRNSAFGRRSGVATVRFTVVGDTRLRYDFAMVFRAPAQSTVRIISHFRTVARYFRRQKQRPRRHIGGVRRGRAGRRQSGGNATTHAAMPAGLGRSGMPGQNPPPAIPSTRQHRRNTRLALRRQSAAAGYRCMRAGLM